MEEPDDQLFLATASGENVKLWNLPNLEDIGLHSIRPYSGIVNCTCWSANNLLLATAFEEQINVAGLKGETSVELCTDAEQLCLCFSSNARYLLSGSKNGSVQIWDLKHKTIRKSFKDHRSSILCVTFNNNDTVIASGSLNGDVLLNNVVSGSVAGPLRTQQTQAVRAIQYSNFKKSLLGTASDDGAVNLWDVSTKQIVKEFKNEHRLPATDICFSPANDMLVCSVGIDKKIFFYDVVGKKSVKSISTDIPLTSVDFFHDGACLVAGSATGKLLFFDLRSGSTPIKTATADKSSVKTVTFQKPVTTKGSSKGLTRKGSDSSNASSTSNKARDKNDSKDSSPESVVNLERKDLPRMEQIASTGQPVTLFSPLRGEAGSTAADDTDIVPIEALRGDIPNIASLASSTLTTDGKIERVQPVPSTSDAMQLRLPERNKNIEDTLESLRSRLTKTNNASHPVEEVRPSMPTNVAEAKTLANGHSDRQYEDIQSQDGNVAFQNGTNGLHPFQIDFIRNLIDDAMEESREAMHRGFIHLQSEMIRQFHLHQEETRRLMEQLSPNHELMKENERLKEEIKRLKTNY